MITSMNPLQLARSWSIVSGKASRKWPMKRLNKLNAKPNGPSELLAVVAKKLVALIALQR